MTFPLSIHQQREIRLSRCPAEPNGPDASCQSRISGITFAAAIQLTSRVVHALRCFFCTDCSLLLEKIPGLAAESANFARVSRTDFQTARPAPPAIMPQRCETGKNKWHIADGRHHAASARRQRMRPDPLSNEFASGRQDCCGKRQDACGGRSAMTDALHLVACAAWYGFQDAGAAAGLGATTRSFSIDTAAPATSAQKGALMLRNVTFDIATISATKAPIW